MVEVKGRRDDGEQVVKKAVVEDVHMEDQPSVSPMEATEAPNTQPMLEILALLVRKTRGSLVPEGRVANTLPSRNHQLQGC